MQNPHDNTSSNWFGCCDGLQILKASRHALQPKKIMLAAVGLILTFLFGSLLDVIWVGTGQGVTVEQLRKAPTIVEISADSQDRHGVFTTLWEHEKYCLDQALKAARKFELAGGMGDIWWKLDVNGGAQLRPQAGQGYGVVAFIIAMLRGLHWAVWSHWFFSLLLASGAIMIWSILGGAICRISALQFARDEQISTRQALDFSRSKFWHFALGPLIPVFVVLVAGLLITLAGWITSLDAVGSLLGVVLFALALLAGLLIAMVFVGTVAGFSLMWPSLAAEGLDCFDSIGRGTSYVYQRAERTVLYAILAFFYGALVWLFVRIFVFILLYATHGFFSAGFPELEQIWDAPTIDNFYSCSAEPAALADSPVLAYVTKPLIALWVNLFVFSVYGYLVSYYFSSSTVIYFLLRRHVDDTELDDVYVAEEDGLDPGAALMPPADAPHQSESSGPQSEQSSSSSDEETD